VNASNDLRKHIIHELTDKFEVYEQDKYIYSYIRSEGGYGNECSLITFPMDYPASVTIGLSFFDEWKRINPKWLSKDLIIVFYKEEDYAKPVREFLEWYYMGHDGLNNQDDVKDLLNNDKQIHGRCGYLR
jgi:hypothetical protein